MDTTQECPTWQQWLGMLLFAGIFAGVILTRPDPTPFEPFEPQNYEWGIDDNRGIGYRWDLSGGTYENWPIELPCPPDSVCLSQ